MLKIRVIQTFKKGNKIIGYRIQDVSNNRVMDVETLHLKNAIADKKCEAVNMTLTTDGRLVQHKEYNISNKKEVKQIINKNDSISLEQELKKLETNDYQNRGGNYPRSGVADTISVYSNFVEASFKNTSEGVAKSWLKRFVESKGYTVEKTYSHQDGDYYNDWVIAQCKISNNKENLKKQSTVDKYSSTIASVKQRFDKILDIYKDNKFTEITGKTGGDTITYRVYNDGTITER